MSYHAVPAETQDQILAAYMTSEKISYIAARYDVDPKYAWRLARKLGIRNRRVGRYSWKKRNAGDRDGAERGS